MNWLYVKENEKCHEKITMFSTIYNNYFALKDTY
jgi:hypothetical protein